MTNELIRIKEAAEILECSPQTIRNMIARGTINGAQKIDPTLKNSPLRIPKNEIIRIKGIRSFKAGIDQTNALMRAATLAAGSAQIMGSENFKNRIKNIANHERDNIEGKYE